MIKNAAVLLSAFCLFTVSSVALSNGALAQTACTEMACSSGLLLTVPDGKLEDAGRYDFHFLIDNETEVTCTGALPLPSCDDGPSVRCDKPGVTIEEEGCALPEGQQRFSDILIGGAPHRVSFRIERNGRRLISRSMVPVYYESRPNGPQCPPLCRIASYALFRNQ